MLRLLQWRPIQTAQPVGGGLPANAAAKFISTAMRFLGQPYLWGGGHGSTFSKPGPVDCSGLVTQAARMSGLNLDGTAAVQQKMGKPISPVTPDNLKAGDLVFMGNPAHHVGIYIGNNRVLEAPHTGDVVKICPLTGYGWDGATRVFDEAGKLGAHPDSVDKATISEAAKRPGPGGTLSVKPGETLWKIAERTLGDKNRWREIYDLNRDQLATPHLVFPGMTLRLPGGGNQPAPAPAPSAVTATSAAAFAPQVKSRLAQLRKGIDALKHELPTVGRQVQQTTTQVALASEFFVKQTAAPAIDTRLQSIMSHMRGQ